MLFIPNEEKTVYQVRFAYKVWHICVSQQKTQNSVTILFSKRCMVKAYLVADTISTKHRFKPNHFVRCHQENT